MDTKSIKVVNKTGVRSAKKFTDSPFLNDLNIVTKNKQLTVSQGSTLIDMKTGEIEGCTNITQIISVDNEQFIKLFTKDLAIWFDLTRPAMRVFGALLAVLQNSHVNKDLIFLDSSSESVKTFGVPRSSFFKGIEELLLKGFIARHVSAGWYFINPGMFFNGDRARFVKEYRINRTAKTAIQRLEEAGQTRLID